MLSNEDAKDIVEQLYDGSYRRGLSEGESEALEIAIEALEKQIPEKPLMNEIAMGGRTIIPCGNCSEEIKYDYDFCPTCGQKIDWSRK